MLPYEKQISELEQFETNGAHALSLYVQTDPARDSGRNRHAQLEALRRQLWENVGDDKDAAQALERNFDDAVAAIDALKPPPRAAAVFACSDCNLTSAVPLRFPVEPQAYWGDHLHLHPLISQMNEHQRALVLLLDKKQMTLYRIFMGEITKLDQFTDELPRGRDADGVSRQKMTRSGSASVAMGYGGLNQERYYMEHVRKHVDHVIEAVQKVQADTPVDRILVSATPEALGEFMRLIPKRWHNLIDTNLQVPMHASDAEVLQAAMAAQETVERQSEEELLEEVFENVPYRGVLGPNDTAEAVADRKVMTLVYAGDAQLAGAECESCGLLMNGSSKKCGRCGEPARELDDLLDILIIRTLQQRGRIEEVRGPAAERLREHHGVAALLRFA